MGRSLLHYACSSGKTDILLYLSKYISPLVNDDKGDTPLHVCSALGHGECVKTVLSLNKWPPILIRNKDGKSPLDVATGSAKENLHKYMKKHESRIHEYYYEIQKHAEEKYSTAERITRIFVVGNPGAGKSSLIATLKEEGLFEYCWSVFRTYFWKVPKSSVPPHTAGIVPSIFSSKYCGRILFYDFAGDPDYYSSHAAILENLASSTKGDNIFILVVDLRDNSDKIRSILHLLGFFHRMSEIQRQQTRHSSDRKSC